MNQYAGYHVMYGGVDPSGQKAVKGNRYGDWDIDQVNRDAKAAHLPYSSRVEVTFIPNPDNVCCTKIAFIQAVRLVDSKTKEPTDTLMVRKMRLTKDGWKVDRLPGAASPWYSINDDGTLRNGAGQLGSAGPEGSGIELRNASLIDLPGWFRTRTTWSYESYAICMEGEDENKLYGGLTWGFFVDGDGKLTSHPNKHLDTPTSDAISAGIAWNRQADLPSMLDSLQNAPDQQTIPDIQWDQP